jgi:spore germination cell wall hydrolase CwlJ-like protein
LDGQVAVANTIMNRVESSKFPDTPCEVVQQGRTWNGHMLRNQCHFSYYCDGKPEVIVDQGAYTLALSIAVNWANLVDITSGATYYHRDDVHPYWIESLNISRKIGRHIFYNQTR